MSFIKRATCNNPTVSNNADYGKPILKKSNVELKEDVLKVFPSSDLFLFIFLKGASYCGGPAARILSDKLIQLGENGKGV